MTAEQTPHSAEKLIVLTREPAANRRWGAELRRRNLAPLGAPMIKTTLAPLTPEMAATLRTLEHFDWLVFTSARGVDALQALAAAAGIPLTAVPPVAAIGPATAATAHRSGFVVKFTAQAATAHTLAQTLTPVHGRRLLLLRTSLATNELAAALTARGATVTELTVYRTEPQGRPQSDLEALIAQNRIRCLTFASPSAVQGMVQSLSNAALTQARRQTTITIGPTTTKVALAHGFTRLHEAAHPNLKSLIEAIRTFT